MRLNGIGPTFVKHDDGGNSMVKISPSRYRHLVPLTVLGVAITRKMGFLQKSDNYVNAGGDLFIFRMVAIVIVYYLCCDSHLYYRNTQCILWQ